MITPYRCSYREQEEEQFSVPPRGQCHPDAETRGITDDALLVNKDTRSLQKTLEIESSNTLK